MWKKIAMLTIVIFFLLATITAADDCSSSREVKNCGEKGVTATYQVFNKCTGKVEYWDHKGIYAYWCGVYN